MINPRTPSMRGWTIRARLTALYGVLFLLSGVILLGVTYILVQQSIRDRPSQSPIKVPADLTIDLGNGKEIQLKGYLEALKRQQREHEDRTLNALLTQGSIALVGVTVVGVGFGWLISERALRPVHRITETARRVAGGNLRERIALGGPRDEITELADTFDSMLERLDRAFHGQRRFVDNASHELRTPLAINRTLIEVALGRPEPSPELRQLGETLLAVNARNERLVEGLLTLARSEQALTVHDPVDLAEVARHVAAEASADRANSSPTVDVTPEPAAVLGDPVLLERLARNLVDNALAYNSAAAGRVWVTTAMVGPHATLVVSNTGPVIPEYEVPRLFEPFYRARGRGRPRGGSQQGTGLGLSIVRSVAMAHGGVVHAEPRPGGGLTVSVKLPGARLAPR